MKSFFNFIIHLNRTRRFMISLAVCGIVFLSTWHNQTVAFTCMVSWIGFAFSSLFFAWSSIVIKHPKQIATIASEQDVSDVVILVVVVAAAFISIFAIILLIHGLPTHSRKIQDIHIVLSVIAVALSWFLIHTLFTIHYAHLYYTIPSAAKEDKGSYAGGLAFPGKELPDFLDFAYYSFVLGMTFQTADVNISDRKFRRLALLQGFLSFVYNTAIIALSINIISGLIGK